jgi:hypothetical protein
VAAAALRYFFLGHLELTNSSAAGAISNTGLLLYSFHLGNFCLKQIFVNQKPKKAKPDGGNICKIHQFCEVGTYVGYPVANSSRPV